MILNETILRQAAQEARRSFAYESYSYSIPHFDAAQNYDLFISHSFKDKDLVTGLYHLFTQAGYKVYIDWIDEYVDVQRIYCKIGTCQMPCCDKIAAGYDHCHKHKPLEKVVA